MGPTNIFGIVENYEYNC